MLAVDQVRTRGLHPGRLLHDLRGEGGSEGRGDGQDFRALLGCGREHSGLTTTIQVLSLSHILRHPVKSNRTLIKKTQSCPTSK